MVELVKGQRLALPNFVAHVWRWPLFYAELSIYSWRGLRHDWKSMMRANYRAALFPGALPVQRVGVVITVFGCRFRGLVWRYHRHRMPETLVTNPARVEAVASGLRAAWAEMQLRASING